MIECTLPIPPSTNNLYFNLKRGGRAKTVAYKDWLKEAREALQVLTCPTFPDKAKMRLTVRVGCNYTRDVTNCVKPIEDALAAFLPVPDDRYNNEIIATRDKSIEGFAHARLEVIE